MKKWFFLVSIGAIGTVHGNFDDAVNAIYEKNPQLAACSAPTTEKINGLTSERFYTIIDTSALLFVLVQLAHSYYQIYYAHGSSDSFGAYLRAGFSYLMPRLIKSFGNHGIFLFSALSITLQALFYKTVAKMVVMCGSGDLLDVGLYVIKATKRIIKTVLL